AVGLAAHALVFLLLALGELFQFVERLVDLRCRVLFLRLLLLSTLHRLILIPHLVFLQLEDVGEILRFRTAAASTTAPAAPAAHRNLNVAEHCLGSLQLHERALFRRERAVRRALRKQFLGAVHFGRGLRQQCGDLLPARIGRRDAAIHEPLAELLHFLPQLLLGETERGDVLVERFLFQRGVVARGVERRRDPLPLPLREGTRIARLAAATAAAPTALLLPVVLAVRTNLQKVDVGGRGLRGTPSVCVCAPPI